MIRDEVLFDKKGLQSGSAKKKEKKISKDAFSGSSLIKNAEMHNIPLRRCD